MMRVQALAVVGEDLDHPALVDATVLAAQHHALQLSLQGLEAGNALLDLAEA
jgi:hypothetical protein